MTMSTDYFGFRFEICSIEETQMQGGESAYIIFFDVANLEPKARLISVSKATYVTENREQLEQDIWLLGYLHGNARIKGNAHRKAGLVFYKRHLNSVVIVDGAAEPTKTSWYQVPFVVLLMPSFLSSAHREGP